MSFTEKTGLLNRQYGSATFPSKNRSIGSFTSFGSLKQVQVVDGVVEGRSSWQRSSSIIIASMLGTGVLGIPFAFAQLGWFWGLLSMSLFAAGSVLSGTLLAELKQHISDAKVYGDLGLAAYGVKGERIIMLIGYLYISGVTVIYQLTATISLQQVFYSWDLCLVTASAIVALSTLPLLQVKSLHEVSLMAAVGVVAIVVPCLIVVVELVIGGAAESTTGAVAAKSFAEEFNASVVGLLNLVYAFAGQAIFVEIMAEMRKPRDFPKAVWFSSSFMMTSYLIVGCVGFYCIGETVEAPITSAVPNNIWKRVINVFLLVHVIVAYVIEANVLSSALLQYVSERLLFDDGPRGKAAWAASTVAVVAGAFVMSNLIPFLGDLMGLFGAVGSVATTYIFPCLCSLAILDAMPAWKRVLCRCLVPLATILATVGVYSSLQNIISKWHTYGKPFSCG